MKEYDVPKLSQQEDDALDLEGLVRIVWDGKWVIGGLVAGAIVISVIVALLLPNVYRAESLLAPREEGGTRSIGAQYSGLASLAGISLPTESGDKSALGIEILKSRKFISGFIRSRDLLVPLMAATRWDASSGELRIDPDIYDVDAKSWVREADPPRQSVPSAQEAYEVFRERLSVTRDDETGFVTVGLEHYSPILAQQWLLWLIEDLNETVRERDVTDAEQAIEFLNDQISRTSLAELRAVLFRLVEEQTKTVMLANVSDEYLFETIDPPVVPEKKSRPDRVLVVLASGFVAGLLGLLIVLVRGSRKDAAAVDAPRGST